MPFLMIFFVGIYVALAMYHLMVYAGRRNDKSNLGYALIVISFGYMTFAMGVIPSLGFIPDPYRTTFWHISIVLGYTAVTASAAYFTVAVVNLRHLRLYAYAVVAICGAVNAFVFIGSKFLGLGTFRELSPLMFYAMGPVGSIFYTIVLVAFLRKKNRSQFENKMFLGISIYLIFFMSHPVLLMMDVREDYAITLANIGMIATMIILAKLLASTFNAEHHELIETKENLEERIRERTRELEDAKICIEKQSAEKTNFFVNLAHETRTPATLIQQYLGNCIQKYPEDSDLAVVKRNVDKLVNDMVNFLDAEKIVQGRLTYDEKGRFSLNNYLNNKVDLILPSAHNSGISVHRDFEPDLFVSTSVHGLDRVMHNILDNALKFTAQGGTICVGARMTTGDKVKITVKDTGCGIPEKMQPFIFDEYYQISHIKNNNQGIGMGLSITKSIVEDLGGQISFESTEAGTEFIVQLPVGSGGDLLELSPAVPSSLSTDQVLYPIESTPVVENKHTIILVEDNRDLLVAMRDALATEYNVLCAEDGGIALELLGMHGAHVIVSDIMMDGMDGYELLDRVRENKELCDIPFIFLTAKSGVKDEIKGLAGGAVDYIQKPFHMEVLRARIRSHAEHGALRKQMFVLEKYRSVGMLSAGICHEIMNPLSGVLGPLYVVERIAQNHGCFEESAFKEGLGYVKDNVKRISNIVETMRTLFHGDSYELQEFDLGDFTQTVVDRFRPKIDSQIAIGVSVPDGITISSNRGALTQIFTNLLTNAADSIDGEGTIHIYSDESTGKNIIFRDSGCGIPEDALKKVFDLAFTTKKDNGGTGLGLYIVKELAERLSIGLSVRSEVGSGSEFELRFNPNATG